MNPRARSFYIDSRQNYRHPEIPRGRGMSYNIYENKALAFVAS